MMGTSKESTRGEARARGPIGASRALFLALAGLLLGATLLAGCAGAGGQAEEQAAGSEAVQQESAPATRDHELGFVVEADGDGDVPASVTVRVSGMQDDGTRVNDSREAAVGKTYVLAYPAGSYTFEVDASSLVAGEVLYKAEKASYAFDGSEDHTVRIRVAQDVEAMREAQAAQEEAARQKAAEEEAAAAAAAAEEEAAAAAAAVAEQEAAAAAAAAPSGGGGSDTVYITNTGEKYHRDGCRYLKKSQIAIERSAAIAQGYGACSVCKP